MEILILVLLVLILLQMYYAPVFFMNSYDELFIMYNSYGTDDDDKFEIKRKLKKII